jgi:hypothetical protein
MAKREPNEHMPQHGLIVRGPLTGWRFAFLRMVSIEGDLYVDLRCTPQDWPFPQTVRFSLTRDRFTLQPVAGERAKRLDAVKLMADAMQHGASHTPFQEK